MSLPVHGAARGAFGLILALTLALSACSSSPRSRAGSGATSPTAGGTSSPVSCASQLTGKVNVHGTKAASGSTVDIDAGDFFFAPTCLTASGTLTVTVKNTGQTLHNISVTAQKIDNDVPVGQSVTVSVKVSGGTVPFFCKYHTGAGMQGAFTST